MPVIGDLPLKNQMMSYIDR